MLHRTMTVMLLLTGLLWSMEGSAQRWSKERKDTVYPSKRTDCTYMEENRNDSVYNTITDYFNSDFNNAFQTDSCSVPHKTERYGLPEKWSEMGYYHGTFYPVIVSPDDIFLFQVNDSFVIFYYNDGPQRHPITSLTRVGKRQYEITYCNYNSYGHIMVYIFNDRTKDAIFYFDNFPEEIRYQVMINQEHIRDYPVIVKNSTCCRTGPFMGDDYREAVLGMIEQVKRKK